MKDEGRNKARGVNSLTSANAPQLFRPDLKPYPLNSKLSASQPSLTWVSVNGLAAGDRGLGGANNNVDWAWPFKALRGPSSPTLLPGVPGEKGAEMDSGHHSSFCQLRNIGKEWGRNGVFSVATFAKVALWFEE